MLIFQGGMFCLRLEVFFCFFFGGLGFFQARWQESVGRFGDRTFTIFERRRLSFQVGFVVVVENHVVNLSYYTPWKINMEHNNGSLEDDFPFPRGDF